MNPGATGSIGDFVWEDLNCDGIQNPGESGVAGVTVNLLNNSGGLIQTTTTNSNGLYSFKGLAAGKYVVEFKPVAGWQFSPALKGGNTKLDSNVTDPATGRTAVITLADGQQNSTIDAGLCKPILAALGDRVWFDVNANGLQDSGEPGVGSVTVNLLDGLGTPLASTTTNSNGIYGFTDLNPGDYIVEFKLPANSLFTTPNVGSNNAIDSNANKATGRTTVITLGSGEVNLTIDAGIIKTEPPLKARLGDFVWFDINQNGIQDALEPGIPNSTVNLLDAAGNFLKTTTTNINGFYLFDDLDPGSYRVEFTKAKAESFSPQTVGSNTAIDSNPNPATGITGVITLAAGESNLTIDAGIFLPDTALFSTSAIRGIVYFDANKSGELDSGDKGISNVQVNLTGVTSKGAPVSRTVFTGADGTYIFTGLDAGTYRLDEIQPAVFLQGTNKAGSHGGIVSGDTISQILLGENENAFAYRFGEVLPEGGDPSKEDLLASSKTKVPTLAERAQFSPSSPDFSNSAAVTKLGNPSIIRYAAAGQGTGGSRVRVFDQTTGANKFDFVAYPGFAGGVRVAVADVTGDGVPDIITAPGPGGGPHIKVYSGVTGAVVSEFFAYSANFRGGVYIAAGDVNGDGVSEIITAAGEGGGPHVKIMSGSGTTLREFFAYSASMSSGVRVAVGDWNGDARVDIITAPGAGSGSHIKVFSGNPAQGLLDEYFAYNPSFTGGVYVAAGDTDGDGKADIITGPGVGGGPHVKVFKGGAHNILLDEHFAYEANFLGGVRVGALDINGDGKVDVITAPASNLPLVIQVRDVQRSAYLQVFLGLDRTYTGGAFVAGGTRRNLPEGLGG